MGLLARGLPKCKVNMTEKVITDGDDQYMFYSQINDQPERIYGLLLSDYQTCGNYKLDRRVKGMLDTHIREGL
jgi:hypothetical protein